jgi:hypothetical protein
MSPYGYGEDINVRRGKRVIIDGDTYTIDDDVEIAEVGAVEEIPVDIQGEPWGWTKGPPFPLDYGRRFPE